MFGMRKKHSTTCTAEDVRFFLLLLYGRAPEHPSEITRREAAATFGLMKTLLKSAEFIRGVLEPLRLGKTLAWLPYDVDQQKCIYEGCLRNFKVRLASAFDRTSALKGITQSNRFLEALDASANGYTATWFVQALDKMPAAKAVHVSGQIEELSVTTCSGYALNSDILGHSLQLDFYINGTFVGSSKADRARREIEETYPGFPNSGFQHTIHLPPHLAALSHLVLAVYDNESGAPICPPREFANMGSRHQHPIIKLHAAVLATKADTRGATRAALDTIEEILPQLSDYAAFPLENYSEHQLLYKHAAVPGHPISKISTAISSGQPTDYQDTADMIVFVRDGETLADGALDWIVYAAENRPEAGLFFTDYDTSSGPAQAVQPTYKTMLDADLLLQRPFEATAYAVRRSHLEKLGGINAADKEAGHFAFWLRYLAAYGEAGFCHIPQILWHTVARNHNTADFLRAANTHFLGQEPRAIASAHTDKFGGDIASCLRTTWPIDTSLPTLAIIIPMRDSLNLTRACVESVRRTLKHSAATEIIIVDNGSIEPETKAWLKWVDGMDGIKVLLHDGPFNWSEINNRAASATDADYLLFLNNDTVALDVGWDHILRGYLNRADVGAVGARLLFEDGTLQFAGYVVNPDTIAHKEAYGETPCRGGYNNRSQLTHQCSALIGAFLACRRGVFDDVGGFDAEQLPIAFNDIDFCLSLRANGHKILYVPTITFQHLESKSRGYDALDDEKLKRVASEHALMHAKWNEQLNHDPWYPDAFVKCEPTHSLLATPRKASINSGK